MDSNINIIEMDINDILQQAVSSSEEEPVEVAILSVKTTNIPLKNQDPEPMDKPRDKPSPKKLNKTYHHKSLNPELL